MSRLQKKCFVASVAMHSTLVLVLFFGAAFLTPKELTKPISKITMIPKNIIDSTLDGGGGTPPPAARPPQAPKQSVVETPVALPPPPVEQPKPVEPPPQPRVEPPARVEPVTPPTPVARETPTPPPVSKKEARPIDRVAPKKTSKTAKTKEAPAETSTKAEKTAKATKAPEEKTGPKVDLSKAKAVVRDNREEIAKQQREYAEYQAQVAAASKARADQSARLDGVLGNLKNNLSSGISIEPVGGDGEGFANYGQVVVSIYENAWVVPQDLADDSLIVQVTVTIARSGKVVRASIAKSSRNATVNRSVQRTLDGVRFIAPFPAGAKDDERTFNIDFNLKAKRLRG